MAKPKQTIITFTETHDQFDVDIRSGSHEMIEYHLYMAMMHDDNLFNLVTEAVEMVKRGRKMKEVHEKITTKVKREVN